MEHCRKFLRALFMLMTLFIMQPLFSCYFTLFFFVTISCFFPFYPCNSFWFCFFFFGNFLYTEHLYKPQSVQTFNHFTFCNTESWRQFPRCFLFSHFLLFSLPFSATKHSSEDDNLEDGWLYLFLLEEEGYWALDLR